MTMSSRMPVLFIGHGSPVNALETNATTRAWAALAAAIPTPKAILAISATPQLWSLSTMITPAPGAPPSGWRPSADQGAVRAWWEYNGRTVFFTHMETAKRVRRLLKDE